MSTRLAPVEELLPHRGRFLLLTRLLSLDSNQAEALGEFTPADVEGHFPGRPVVPGVLLLEGLAQTLACLDRAWRADSLTPDAVPLLASFDRVRFRVPLVPPVQVLYRVTVEKRRLGMTTGKGEVVSGGRVVCSARLMATVVNAADALPEESNR